MIPTDLACQNCGGLDIVAVAKCEWDSQEKKFIFVNKSIGGYCTFCGSSMIVASWPPKQNPLKPGRHGI